MTRGKLLEKRFNSVREQHGQAPPHASHAAAQAGWSWPRQHISPSASSFPLVVAVSHLTINTASWGSFNMEAPRTGALPTDACPSLPQVVMLHSKLDLKHCIMLAPPQASAGDVHAPPATAAVCAQPLGEAHDVWRAGGSEGTRLLLVDLKHLSIGKQACFSNLQHQHF